MQSYCLSTLIISENLTNKFALQYHTPAVTRQLAAGFAEAMGWKMSDYDGHVEFLVRSVDDLYKAVQDPDYPEKVAPDEKYLLDPSTSAVTVGWEEVYVLDGNIVNIMANGASAYA